MQFKRVLVAVDFSERSRRAVERVVWLALEPGAVVVLLHVLPDGAGGDMRAERAASEALFAEAEALEEAARIAGRSDLRVETVLGRGRPFPETLRHLREVDADLLVLGRVGESGLRDVFLGSTARGVLRDVNVPVLLVERRPEGPYRRVSVAVDPFEPITPVVLPAVYLAGRVASEVELLHAAELPEYRTLEREGARRQVLSDYTEETCRRARAAFDTSVAGLRVPGCRVKQVMGTGDPRELLPRWAEERSFELLVLGSHHRGGLERAVLGSVAADVVQKVACDTLVVPLHRWIERRSA